MMFSSGYCAPNAERITGQVTDIDFSFRERGFNEEVVIGVIKGV